MSKDRIFGFLGNHLNLAEPADSLSACLDTIFVACACPAQNNQRILDTGCGIGSAGFCVLHHVPTAHIIGIDRDETLIAYAQKNALTNHLEDQTHFLVHTIHAGAKPSTDSFLGLHAHSFDHVMCNPPFLHTQKHTLPCPTQTPCRNKALGHTHTHNEDSQNENAQNENTSESDFLSHWLDFIYASLKPRGTLTLIHRADCMDWLMRILTKRWGAIEIFPLFPHKNAPASRLIIRCVPNRKTPPRLHTGMILHDSQGNYTQEANAILRGESRLSF